MPQSNNDILRDYLERVRVGIISQQRNLNIRLTGFSAGSLQVERTRSSKSGRFEAGAVLTSDKYLVTNFKDVGVKPGTFPPFGAGSKLEKWVIQRGLVTVDKTGRLQTTAQTSFLVARKIAAEGTEIYKSGGIDFVGITRDELPETSQLLAENSAVSIVEQWNKAILL